MSKKKSLKSQKNKYQAIETSCFLGEFVAVAAPFIAVGIANYDKYFVQYDGTKMSISFVLAMIVMGMAILLISKKKMENSYVTLLIGWAVVATIFTLLGQIIVDISTIMWFGLIGLGSAWGLELGSKAAKKKKESVKATIEQVEKELAVEQYKQEKLDKEAEKETKKIKVKIKK